MPSSSYTRHRVQQRKRSVCVCVREGGVLVFPASTSIKSQPLKSEGSRSLEAVRALLLLGLRVVLRGFDRVPYAITGRRMCRQKPLP